MTERWKPVVGWEGYYEVSDQGRVRSLDRTLPSGPHKGWTFPGKVLRPSLAGRGYPVVMLTLTTKRREYQYVHRLVYTAFRGAIPSNRDIDHKDRDRRNNTPGNLRLSREFDNVANNTISKGVTYSKKWCKWVAYIKRRGRYIHLGGYSDSAVALEARQAAQKLLLGRFCPHTQHLSTTAIDAIRKRIYRVLHRTSRGVSYVTAQSRWLCYVQINKTKVYFGSFRTRASALACRRAFDALGDLSLDAAYKFRRQYREKFKLRKRCKEWPTL